MATSPSWLLESKPKRNLLKYAIAIPYKLGKRKLNQKAKNICIAVFPEIIPENIPTMYINKFIITALKNQAKIKALENTFTESSILSYTGFDITSSIKSVKTKGVNMSTIPDIKLLLKI